MKCGNSSGNIMNSGTCLEFEGRLYFVGDDFFIYVTDGEPEDCECILRERGRYLNGYDGRVYFTDSEARLCSMDRDGGDVVRLNDSMSYCVNVVDGYIYYRNETDGKKIYCMNLDGSDDHPVCDDVTFFLNVHGDRLFYRNDSDGMTLYSMSLRDGSRSRLTDDVVFYPVIYRDRIYYSNKTKERIHSMNLDGSDDRCVNDAVEGYYLNVDDGRIYYRSYTDRHYLYSMSVDGADNRLLLDEDVFQINRGGRWLFFCVKREGGAVRHLEL